MTLSWEEGTSFRPAKQKASAFGLLPVLPTRGVSSPSLPPAAAAPSRERTAGAAASPAADATPAETQRPRARGGRGRRADCRAPARPPSCGVVSSRTHQAAVAVSLPMKKAETGLPLLQLWGKVQTMNGSDYLVALGSRGAHMFEGKIVAKPVYFYCQDGMTWVDLTISDVSEEQAARCAKLTSVLSGEPSTVYTVEEPAPAPEGEPAEPAEGEEAPPAPEPVTVEVTELERLKTMISSISLVSGIVPKGALVLDAGNNITFNRTFSGIPYPDKLDSYIHSWEGPDGSSLATDPEGSWAVKSDDISGQTTLCSLVYPGFAFYYSSVHKTWGGLYVGTGVKNTDLLFLL